MGLLKGFAKFQLAKKAFHMVKGMMDDRSRGGRSGSRRRPSGRTRAATGRSSTGRGRVRGGRR